MSGNFEEKAVGRELSVEELNEVSGGVTVGGAPVTFAFHVGAGEDPDVTTLPANGNGMSWAQTLLHRGKIIVRRKGKHRRTDTTAL